MKFSRLAFSITLSFLTTSIFIELMELTIVLSKTDIKLSELITHVDEYMAARNGGDILSFKLIYNLMGGMIGGFLLSVLVGPERPVSLSILMSLQGVSLVWVGFFSGFANNLSTLFWLALMVSTLVGIWAGWSLRNYQILRREID